MEKESGELYLEATITVVSRAKPATKCGTLPDNSRQQIQLSSSPQYYCHNPLRQAGLKNSKCPILPRKLPGQGGHETGLPQLQTDILSQEFHKSQPAVHPRKNSLAYLSLFVFHCISTLVCYCRVASTVFFLKEKKAQYYILFYYITNITFYFKIKWEAELPVRFHSCQQAEKVNFSVRRGR